VHRLNRAEYANAIRDLLALDVDTSTLLPPDDAAYGFDNIADALGVSPVLLERYLAAAGKISSLAVGDPGSGPAGETIRIRQDASQDTHIEGLPVGRLAGSWPRRHFRSTARTISRSVCSGPISASFAASSTSTSSNIRSTARASTCPALAARRISRPTSRT